jgi:hypothetical protein
MTSLSVTSTTVARLSKKRHMFLRMGLALFLLHHCQVHASTRASHSAREVASELILELVQLVDQVLIE